MSGQFNCVPTHLSSLGSAQTLSRDPDQDKTHLCRRNASPLPIYQFIYLSYLCSKKNFFLQFCSGRHAPQLLHRKILPTTPRYNYFVSVFVRHQHFIPDCSDCHPRTPGNLAIRTHLLPSAPLLSGPCHQVQARFYQGCQNVTD